MSDEAWLWIYGACAVVDAISIVVMIVATIAIGIMAYRSGKGR